MSDNFTSSSNLPEKVSEFYNKIGGVGNIYHIYTENMDGEITNEVFAKNVITDYGLYMMRTLSGCSTGDSSYSFHVYIGNSTEQPDPASSSMDSSVTTTNSILDKNNSPGFGSYNTYYPLRYIPNRRIFTQNLKIARHYFDYNITDASGNTATEPITITEIGFGKSTTTLLSHALICNENGQTTSITKNPNEKLFITIYWQGAVSVDYIEDNWSKGIHTFIQPYMFTYPGKYGDYMYVGYLNRAKHVCHSNISYNTRYVGGDYDTQYFSNTENSVSKRVNTSSPNKLYENEKHYVSGILATWCNDNYRYKRVFDEYYSSYSYYPTSSWYYDAWVYGGEDTSSSTLLHKFLYSPTLEDIDIIDVYTNSYASRYFSQAFGQAATYDGIFYGESSSSYFLDPRGRMPIVQCDISSITRYNHATKAWDIEEEFNNAPNTNYDTSTFSIPGRLLIESSQNTGANGVNYRVFFNPHNTTRTITSFNNSGITLYATDTYWDISSYEIIPNLAAVPESLGKKRFYCVKSNDFVVLWPSFNAESYHTLSATVRSISGVIQQKMGGYDSSELHSKPLTSEVNNWILFSRELVYPDADGGPTHYPITGYGGYTSTAREFRHIRFATDDKLLIGCGSANSSDGRKGWISFRLYDVSDPYNAPTYTDITLPFTNKSTSDNATYAGCIYSWAKDGYLCAQQYAYNEAVIFNVNDPDNSITITNCKYAHISNISNKTVYYCTDITNVARFKVMNTDGEIEDTFELPDDRTYTINGIIGWKQNVYISVTSNGTDLAYHYDLNTHVLTSIDHWTAMKRNIDARSAFYQYSEDSTNDFYISQPPATYDGRGNIFIVSSDDPLTPRHLLSTNLSEGKRYYNESGRIYFIDDGNNIIWISKLTSSDETCSYGINVVDVGRCLDEGQPASKIPTWNFPTGSSYKELGIYKNQFFYLDNGASELVLELYPVSQILAHRIVGKTNTITAVNNPFRISNVKFGMSITNDISKIADGNYDTSVNVVE